MNEGKKEALEFCRNLLFLPKIVNLFLSWHWSCSTFENGRWKNKHSLNGVTDLWLGRRGARWNIFIPKIPILVKFGGPWNGKCRYIIWPFGILFGHLVYVISILYILWTFGIFFRRLGILYQVKSGSPAHTICHHSRKSVLEWNVALARGGQGLRIRIVRLWVRIPVRVKSVKTCYVYYIVMT
jgi:hypothetical protein